MKKGISSELSNGSKCNAILRSALNLNHLEVVAYRILVSEGAMRTDDLAKHIEKDRSTAYRCLKNLVASDVCVKEIVNLDKGGYYHLYSAIPPEQVKIRMKECTEQWYQATCDAIEGFPYDD